MKAELLSVCIGLWMWVVLAGCIWGILEKSPWYSHIEKWGWKKREANWITVSLVVPLAMPLIAVALGDYHFAWFVLWPAYAIGIPISAGVVRLVLRAKRQNLVVAAALCAYSAMWASTRHAGAWETLLPAVAALTTAAIAARLYRAT